jgi:hypothetical protein
VKALSGAGGEGHLHGEETEHLEEEKAQEGHGWRRRLNPGGVATGPGAERKP